MSEEFIYELFRWYRLCKIGKIYPIKIYKGDKIILDVRPCRREPDGVKGVYEAVNNEFYSIEQIIRFMEDEK